MEGRSCRRGLATTLVLSTQQYLARGHWMTGCGTVRCHAPLYSAMRADPLLRNACLVAPRRAEYHLLYHVQH